METHFIVSVKIVQGKTLDPGWKSNMQVIQTDKGIYIDNIVGNQFGYFKDAAPGYDWAAEVAQSVNGVRVFVDSGYRWLNKKS